MSRKLLIAVDATERSRDPVALGKVLAEATSAPAVLVSVFPYHPLADPGGDELSSVRDEGRGILLELAAEADLDVADARVIAGNLSARALQGVTEEDDVALIVVGSTSRGSLGRLMPGGVGERLLAGAACPVTIAPRGYADRPAERLERVGVAFDGSQEARLALAAGVLLARSSGAELRVMSAFEPAAFGAMATLGTHGASVNEQVRSERRRELDEVVAELPAEVRADARFLDGAPGEVLAAESGDLDLLVTGSRGYGPRAAVLLGSTTHALSRAAACPMLVLPRGLALDLAD